jgi:hypothetical protein
MPQNLKSSTEKGVTVDVFVSGDSDGKLSSEQMQNWRKVLCGMLGPYALIASDAEIQRMRNTFQERINQSR